MSDDDRQPADQAPPPEGRPNLSKAPADQPPTPGQAPPPAPEHPGGPTAPGFGAPPPAGAQPPPAAPGQHQPGPHAGPHPYGGPPPFAGSYHAGAYYAGAYPHPAGPAQPAAPYGYPAAHAYGYGGYPVHPGYGYAMPTPPGAIDPVLLANQGMRLLARVIDMVLMLVTMLMMIIPMAIWADSTHVHRSDVTAAVLAVSWSVLIFLLYEPLTTALLGWTFGKRICNLRVARLEDGRRLGMAGSWGRYGILVGMKLAGSFCLVGLLDSLWCCWDRPNRQCLHDKAVNSVVVRITI